MPMPSSTTTDEGRTEQAQPPPTQEPLEWVQPPPSTPQEEVSCVRRILCFQFNTHFILRTIFCDKYFMLYSRYLRIVTKQWIWSLEYSPRICECGGGGVLAGGRSEEYRANEAAGLVAAGGNSEAGERDFDFKDCAESESIDGLRLTHIFEIFFSRRSSSSRGPTCPPI